MWLFYCVGGTLSCFYRVWEAQRNKSCYLQTWLQGAEQRKDAIRWRWEKTDTEGKAWRRLISLQPECQLAAVSGTGHSDFDSERQTPANRSLCFHYKIFCKLRDIHTVTFVGVLRCWSQSEKICSFPNIKNIRLEIQNL